jgi:phosphoribosylaminoimidazole-succinocarboxamide synthase
MAGDRIEAINLLLEGMVTTAETRRYISKFESAGIFPPSRFEQLKEFATEAELFYKGIVSSLGSIPVRLELEPGPTTPAEIVYLDEFSNGLWHYAITLGESSMKLQHSSTPQDLKRAVWAALLPQPENLQSE